MRKPVLALVVGLSLLSINASAHAVSLDFAPVSQTVVQGNPFSVALVISGLGNMTAPSLSTFDVDITFNPALVSFSSAVFGDSVLGDQLDLSGLGGNPMSAGPAGPGVVNLFESSFDLPGDLDAFQADSFTLARLTFNALAQGQSALTLAVNALGDANGDPLTATVGSAGEVTVTAPSSAGVPEPSTIALFVTGCLGLLGYRWVRRSLGSHQTKVSSYRRRGRGCPVPRCC